MNHSIGRLSFVSVPIILGIICIACCTCPVIGSEISSKDIPSIEGPVVITEPGTYTIEGDISFETSGSCIVIEASDVIIEGGRHEIRGNGRVPGSKGIYIAAGCERVTVREVKLTGLNWGIACVDSNSGELSYINASDNSCGIQLEGSHSIVLDHCTLKSNDHGVVLMAQSTGNRIENSLFQGKMYQNVLGSSAIAIEYSDSNSITGSHFLLNFYGIELCDAKENEISENIIEMNEDSGIILVGESDSNSLHGNVIRDNLDGISFSYHDEERLVTPGNNHIFDNFFRNNVNVYFEGTIKQNTWNIAKGDGENIAGGPSLGGNFWGGTNNQGYSEVTPDTDGDGFCDSPFQLAPDNTDFLPLVLYATPITTVPTTIPVTPSGEIGIISGPTIIDTPGTYRLEGNISVTGTNPAIEIVCSDVIIDGEKMNIYGPGADLEGAFGIYIHRSPSRVTIRNLHIQGFYAAIVAEGMDGFQIDHIKASGNSYGKYLTATQNGVVEYCTLTESTWEGLIINTGSSEIVVRKNEFLENGGNGIGLSGSRDITIDEDNIIQGNKGGIWLENSWNNLITGNSISANHHQGICLSSSNENTIDGNRITDNNYCGILLQSLGEGFPGSGDNLVYNNYFLNTVNLIFHVNNTNYNSWNIERRDGRNIVGGPVIGGNYYGTPAGDGFSQAVSDNDRDGICDQINILYEGNIDYLPLKDPGSPLPTATPTSGSVIPVFGPMVIDTPGTYVLQNDLTGITEDNCIDIRASNVVFDGARKTIGGISGEESSGIRVEPGVSGITIKDIKVTGWEWGVYLLEARDSRIEFVNASSCLSSGVRIEGCTGIELNHCTGSSNDGNGIAVLGSRNTRISSCLVDQNYAAGILSKQSEYTSITDGTLSKNNDIGLFLSSDSYDQIYDSSFLENKNSGMVLTSIGNCTISGNHICENLQFGVWLQPRESTGDEIVPSSDNLIFNNYFMNGKNVGDYGFLEANRWNIAPKSGKNIIVGDKLGGNFWGQPDGLGFSQITPDHDGDGFCDGAITIAKENVDFYPLAGVSVSPTPTTAPNWQTVSISGPVVISSPGLYILENDIPSCDRDACIEITISDVVLEGQKHLISGLMIEDSMGIKVAKNLKNITIQNVKVTNWHRGIYIDNSMNCAIRYINASYNSLGIQGWGASGNEFSHITASNNIDGGIFLMAESNSNTIEDSLFINQETAIFIGSCNDNIIQDNQCEGNLMGVALHNSHGNVISGNSLKNNEWFGIMISSSKNNICHGNYIEHNTIAGISLEEDSDLGLEASNENSIYDNYFMNTKNVVFFGTILHNNWNIPETSGRNIVGRNSIGGNFWGQPDGKGFSQQGRDADGDGFVDEKYTIAANNIDNLPLMGYISPTQTVTLTPVPTTTPTSTPLPTTLPSPSPTQTVSPTPTPDQTSSPTPTLTPAPTATPDQTPDDSFIPNHDDALNRIGTETVQDVDLHQQNLANYGSSIMATHTRNLENLDQFVVMRIEPRISEKSDYLPIATGQNAFSGLSWNGPKRGYTLSGIQRISSLNFVGGIMMMMMW
ncbi:MAG TPA: NosD domain-containing protein [Methanoregulaceae archaeon]|nr:NosD domain-containing protein [Methanoregulaceae archaeon]